MKKNRLFYFLIALVIAFGLWAYVVTTVSPESEATYYNIPVVLNNESVLKDKGFMVVTETDPTVTLKLRGNRSDLNNLKNSDISVVADLAKINDAGEQTLTVSVFFTGTDNNNAFEILNQNPSQVTLEIARWSTKEVDVVPNFIGSVGEFYIDYREDIVLDREKITITGPKTVVDQITQARVDVDLTGKTETISDSTRFTLCNDAGEPVDASDIKTNAAEISYTLKILRTKTLNLVYNVEYVGGATASNTTITLDYSTIVVAGSEAILSELGSTLDLGTVDLSEDTQEKIFTITEGMLKGAENVSQLWQVKATITLPELENTMLYVPVENITITGLPEGMIAEVIPVSVGVTIRGYAEQLANITESDIAITVDLSQAIPGANRYLGAVTLNATDSQWVSVIGTYYIDINVTEIVDEPGGTP